MNKFRDISFVVCVFLSLGIIRLGLVDLYYYYLLIIILFPLLLFKHKTIDINLGITCVYLLSIGLVNVILANNDLLSFFKIFVSTLISFWYYYLIIKDTEFDLLYLFKLYYKYAFILACIGFFQFFSFLVNFRYGYDLSWLGVRTIAASEIGGSKLYPIHSLISEPAHYAALMSPAICISLARLLKRNSSSHIGTKFEAMVILLSILLSQSSTGYMTLLFALMLVYFNRINFVRLGIGLILLPLAIFSLYFVSPKFKERLDSSIGLATGKMIIDAANTSETNGSALVLFNHFLIAKRNAVITLSVRA